MMKKLLAIALLTASCAFAQVTNAPALIGQRCNADPPTSVGQNQQLCATGTTVYIFNSGSWTELSGGGGGGTPAGSTGDLQTNAGSGNFGAITPGSGIATWLATPSGANLASALTTALPATKGGTGLTSLGTGVATALGINVGSAGSPLVNGGVLGTPSSGTATNLTGLPLASGITGFGTGIATALAVNVGTAGSPVINGGALGTPSSGVGTNLTGTAAGLTAGSVTTNANLTGPITSTGNATAVAAQTGTGSVFVMQASPTLTTPNIGTPSAGVATNLTGTASGLTAGSVTTNANLTGPITSTGNATAVAAQTGTGSTFVMQASPTLTTPTIGVATATSVNKMAITAPASGSTLAVADGKTLTASNSLTLAGTDSTTITFQGTDTYVGRATTDTLTNKTLTAPVIASISNSGTVTIPTGTDTLANLAGVQTFTNKRINPRASGACDETSSATSTPLGDSCDQWDVTALAAADAFAAPSGTPVNGQKLIIRIKDNGTARALTWNAIYRASSDLALPSTTVLSKTLYLGFVYNTADSKWDMLALLNNL